jgi:cytochrome d ubiquinol oxidase subunit I
MDVLELARLQFAATGSLHFLFVVLTLGLAPLVAIMHTRWALSGRPLQERMTRFWGQIYVINYALGIVTGLVMEFQFGLSWSGLTHYAGDVFGAPLAMETLVAFFLESTFLGLWIFGWGRLPKWAHLACIWLVTATAYASAFYIMVANSFLQNPAGAVLSGGRLELTDFGALLTNKALVFSFPHVLGAGLFTGAMVLVGASAYQLRRRTAEVEFFTRSLRIGVVTASIGIFLTMGFGYAQFAGVPEGKYQSGTPGLVPLGLMTDPHRAHPGALRDGDPRLAGQGAGAATLDDLGEAHRGRRHVATAHRRHGHRLDHRLRRGAGDARDRRLRAHRQGDQARSRRRRPRGHSRAALPSAVLLGEPPWN